MRMEKSIKASGFQVKNREEEYSSKLIIHHTQENGLMIHNMAMDSRNGPMEQSIKVIFNMVKKKAMEY